MLTPVVRFNQRLGRRLQDLRKAKPEIRQEQIASAARAMGLKWSRSTVTAIERGGRQLFVYELVALPSILHGVGIPDVQISDLLSPDHVINPWLSDLIQERAQRHQQRLQQALKQHSRDWEGWYRRIFGRPPQFPKDRPEGPESFTTPAAPAPADIDVIAEEDALVKAASRSRPRVPPYALAMAAVKCWGRGFSEEREARLQRGNVSARVAQAQRGHVSRALLKELHPLIAGKSKRSRKGG